MMTPGRMVYLARRRLSLGFRHWLAERVFERRIDAWRVDPSWPEAPVPVHLLTSQHDWRMALWMLASLHHFTKMHWPIILHEDGSLGEEELGLFQRLCPGLRAWQRGEADSLMASRLTDYPRCADYRARMPHGLKSFDIPQLAETPRFLMLDPDVLFFKCPQKILDWAADPSDDSCWFNQDFQEPSPIPPERAVTEFGSALWPRVNTGLCLLTREAVVNLDAMETWLAHPALQDPKIQWRVEQTLLALAASKADKGGLLPSSYEVSPNKCRHIDSVARHYVGCVRDRFLGEGVFDLHRPLTSDMA